MKIESPEFEHESVMPPKFTCDGEDSAPPLKISGIPKDAKTLVLVVDDPDAPAGTWVHWTAWNIPAAETLELEGDLPAGSVEGVTSFGNTGYGGPCPPSGTHRYFFKVYALDAELELPSETMLDGIMAAMEGHVIEKARLVGTYARQ
jgi:Raf kinase inhibitor-like YbhB/YbcL family protein